MVDDKQNAKTKSDPGLAEVKIVLKGGGVSSRGSLIDRDVSPPVELLKPNNLKGPNWNNVELAPGHYRFICSVSRTSGTGDTFGPLVITDVSDPDHPRELFSKEGKFRDNGSGDIQADFDIA